MTANEMISILVISSEDFHQSKFIPWWVENYEKFTYRYHIMDRETVQDMKACLEKCRREELLSPAGKLGLTLFHLLVWHNFYDEVKEILQEGRISHAEADMPDHNGHGLTPLMLACARGNYAMAKLLLDHGAQDSCLDDRGMNACHFLAYPRFEELSSDSDALERSVEQRAEIARLLMCDINLKNAKGLTPLEHMLSTEYCSAYTWPLTEIFLEKGASTDYLDEDGNTLLMLARRNGHDTAALQLMKHCPELLDMPNKRGITPVMHAIDYCNNAMYLALIDHGAAPAPNEYINQFPLSQITCNTFGKVYSDNRASLSLGLYMAEKLIRQTDPDDDDEVGELISVLQDALRSDDKARILDMCNAAGLDFTTPFYYHGETICLRDECIASRKIHTLRKLAELSIDLNKAVIKGQTPANILASDNSCNDDDELFLQEAAMLFSKESMEETNNRGEAAVHLAAENGHALMMKAMIEKGVNINLTEDAPAEAGTTPLHLACTRGHTDIVKLLMNAGADDTLKTVKGYTPAHLVMIKNNWGKTQETSIMAELLKELQHLDIPDEDGRTPFMLVRYNTKELLPLFLNKGVEVNHRDSNGMTALMLSVNKDMYKELIRAGADINMTDNNGNTALHYALMQGAQGEARYLIKKGADYNRSNNQGETPIQLAVEKNCETVLAIILPK